MNCPLRVTATPPSSELGACFQNLAKIQGCLSTAVVLGSLPVFLLRLQLQHKTGAVQAWRHQPLPGSLTSPL